MPAKKLTENLSVRFLVKGAAAWAISAVVLLLIAALIASQAKVGEGAMGYFSSAVSFLAACFAGSAAGRQGKAGGLYVGLVMAAVLTTILLTLGFIIRGSEIESSAVLSVVSFTFSGCLVGSTFLQGGTRKNRKTRFSPGQRRG